MNEKALKTLEFYKILEGVKKYCKTKASMDLVEELKPYENVYEVNMHLDETREALDLLEKKGSAPFEGLYDVREPIKMLQKGAQLQPGQLLKMANMLKCARNFKGYISHKEEEKSYKILEELTENIVIFKSIEDAIFIAIISEEELSDRASSTLYNIRKALKDKISSVKDKVNSLIRENSKYLQDNLYTMRGDRYVLPVRAEHKGAVKGIVHDQSSSGATIFIEPASLVHLNNEIKELMLKEKAEIERILMELSNKLYENIEEVAVDSDIINELDFIFAKASYASHNNCIAPAISEDGAIDIVAGRHPLIDPKVVVATDIYLGRDFTSLIITGPNTGGKTVTLKTAGLLQLMALSGLMIPARENSTVAFFKEIYADIGDEQSIEQSLSTFSSHMTNIVRIINEAEESSLILFDELGAGTDPVEGAALAVSILDNLKERKARIIATTHYSELKAYALKTEGVENASVEFDVETLRPTYRLIIGIPGKSNAFEISRRLGLPDYIIEDSKSKITKDSLKFEDLIQSLQEKTLKAEDSLRAATMTKIETEKLKEDFLKKRDNLMETRQKAIQEASIKGRNIINEAMEEADKILKNIREFERLGYTSEARSKIEEEKKKLKEKEQKLNSKIYEEEDKGSPLKNPKEGMEAYLPSLKQKVILLTKPDSKGEVLVQAGIMKINVSLKDLRETQGTAKKPKTERREAKLKHMNVSSSVDLRGMDAEEALYNADKYLDEAYLAALSEVTLIHGKGTGVLRNSITEMLKRHPHVKSYRLGEYGEGGNGVTIVILK